MVDEGLFKKMFDNPPPVMGIPDENKFPRIIPYRIPCTQEVLKEHLEKYIQILLDEGADEVKVIRAQDIPQDPRVILKCSHPKCPAYGRSGSCPPYITGDFNKAKQYLNAYEWSIVYRLNIPQEGLKYLSSPSQIKAIRNKESYHALGSLLRYVHGMGDLVERAAFYDGHYFAINCHFGPCLYEYCESYRDCQEIKAGRCRFPYRARSSVEQFFSIDLLKLAIQLGWEYYMLGPCVFPQDFPEGYRPCFLGGRNSRGLGCEACTKRYFRKEVQINPSSWKEYKICCPTNYKWPG